MNKYLKLITDILIFSIGSIGSKLILFFMVPLYTNCLTTDEYGTIEIIYTFEQLLVPFASLTIFDAVLRFGLSKYEKKENILKCALLVLGIGSLFTIAVTPLIELYKTVSDWKWYISVYVILSMFGSVLQNYIKVENKNFIFALVSIIQTLTLAICNVLFLVVKDFGINGYMHSIFISKVISIVLCIIFGNILKELHNGKIEKDTLLRMIGFSAPLILNNIGWWVIHSSDKIMLELMISTSAVGLYTIAYKIPSLINVITSIFQSAWGISSVNEIENDNDTSFYSDVLLVLMLLVFGGAIMIILVLKPFMSIYVGKNFFDAWKYVPLLLAAACFSTISSFFGSLYGALKKSINNMLTTLIAAAVNIFANFLCILKNGIIGAAIGTVIAFWVVSIIRMIDCHRYIKMDSHILLYLINTVIILLLAVFIFYDYNIYLCSLIALLTFLAVNAKNIFEVIKIAKSFWLQKRSKSVKN